MTVELVTVASFVAITAIVFVFANLIASFQRDPVRERLEAVARGHAERHKQRGPIRQPHGGSHAMDKAQRPADKYQDGNGNGNGLATAGQDGGPNGNGNGAGGNGHGHGKAKAPGNSLEHKKAGKNGNGKSKKKGWGLSPAFVQSLAQQVPEIRRDHKELDKDLRKAGFYKPTARHEYLALRNGMMILSIIVAGIIAAMVGPEHQTFVIGVILAGLAVTAMAWALPRVVVTAIGTRRIRKVRRSLPNALDMISMCLAGGLPLRDALTHVGRELYFAHPELAVEFLILRQQADMDSIQAAFMQFADRVDAPEIRSMANMIAQNQKLGTNVSVAIYEYADHMRVHRRQTADEKASKASVKLLLPLSLCLVPSVIMLMWGPGVLRIWEFFLSFEGAATF